MLSAAWREMKGKRFQFVLPLQLDQHPLLFDFLFVPRHYGWRKLVGECARRKKFDTDGKERA